MATYYVDTDAATNGSGTELSPFNTVSSIGLSSGHTVYLKGSVDSVFTNSSSSYQFFYIQLLAWPGTTEKSHKVILDQTGAGYWRMNASGLICYGIQLEWKLSNSSNRSIFNGQNGPSKFFNCDISFNKASTGDITFFQSATNHYSHYFNCDIDCGDLLSWGVRISESAFINCNIHNWTSLTAVFMELEGATCFFENNKFYDISTPEGILKDDIADEACLIQNNSFYMTDATPVLNFDAKTSEANSTSNFYANVVAYTVANNLVTGLNQSIRGYLRGNNLFYNVNVGLWVTHSDHPDLTDTSLPFKSVDDTNSEFMELKATSNGKFAHGIYANRDIGAVQGVGNVLFPDTGDVKAGVSYGNGVSGDRTGTRTDAPVADVRDGVLYGDPDAQLEGTLVAYDDDDVIESAGGNYKTVTEAQVEAAVEFGPASNRLTGQATLLNPLPTHIEVTVYTSDGSNISGDHPVATKVFNVAVGTVADTWLASLGVSETIAAEDAVVERNTQNQNFIQIKLVR